MRELAFLNKGIKITLTDNRTLIDEYVTDANGNYSPTGKQIHKHDVFYSQEGLKEFIKYLDASQEELIPEPICVTSDKIIPIDIALQYNTGYKETILSYVNNIHTIEGGTHLQGFKMGLSRSLRNYADKNKMLEKLKVELSQEDFREGLTAIVSVKVAEPQFEGQTKTKLGNSEVTSVVSQARRLPWTSILRRILSSPRLSLKRLSLPQLPEQQLVRLVRWFSVRQSCQVPECRVSLQTAQSAILKSASSSSSREIPQAVRLNRAVTVAFRQSFR